LYISFVDLSTRRNIWNKPSDWPDLDRKQLLYMKEQSYQNYESHESVYITENIWLKNEAGEYDDK
jgi:hypothetical protein